ncbi:MAG: ABC transporter substrate-binding protein [Alphaproteobacteria bacterium]|nr:ABC transporter substrate-binding protein [Alphaproteobacteria bacterium]
MKRLSRFVYLSLIAFTLTLGTPQESAAQAPNDQAAQFIGALAQNALGALQQPNMTLEQRETVVREMLRNGFDVPFIGRFVLGKHWATVTNEQRDEYQRLFGEFVVKTYAARLGGYSGDKFAVTSVRDAGDKDVLVHTQIVRPSGPPLECDWRVRVIDGQPRIIDVMVEGISMVVTQRSEFASLVQRNGIEGLLASLRAKTGRIGATTSS